MYQRAEVRLPWCISSPPPSPVHSCPTERTATQMVQMWDLTQNKRKEVWGIC